MLAKYATAGRVVGRLCRQLRGISFGTGAVYDDKAAYEVVQVVSQDSAGKVMQIGEARCGRRAVEDRKGGAIGSVAVRPVCRRIFARP